MRALLPLIAAVVLAAPAAAGATTFAKFPTVAIHGASGPGPAKYDKVFVTKFGPSDARRVLVLVPGTGGGAGDFSLVAQTIVKRVSGLQVWAMDRREQALEDTSQFQRALTGQTTPLAAFNYYLGWFANPQITTHYQPLDAKDFGFTRQWGLKLAMEDLRQVVLAARRGGRKVILGGHSLGASEAVAYASWDFAGRPGYKDLSGLMLIDGGLMGTFHGAGPKETKQRLAALAKGSPWEDLLGTGLPWAAGAFAEAGGVFALSDPNGASPVQDFPLLPPALKPPVRATNQALLGYALDEGTSPAALRAVQVHAGTLAATGDPREWVDTDITPIANLAALFAHEPNAVDWYYPNRLTIDVDGADKLTRNATTKLLGLRTWHRRGVNVPLFALQTSLTNGGVLRGARRFFKGSHIRRAVLVDASDTQSHLDPLTASPSRNAFLIRAVPWLKRLH